MRTGLRWIAGLFCVGVFATGATAALARAATSVDVPTEQRAADSIGATHDRHSADPRAGQQFELISKEQRAITRLQAVSDAIPEADNAPPAIARQDATNWCGVVQCRRLSGALLLGYATPPPANHQR